MGEGHDCKSKWQRAIGAMARDSARRHCGRCLLDDAPSRAVSQAGAALVGIAASRPQGAFVELRKLNPMKAQPTPLSRRALLIAAAACLLASCTMMRQMPAQREAKQRTEQLQELQLDVMRFADEYRNRVGEMAGRFQGTAPQPEERLAGQNWKLTQAESVYLIASGPNPLTNALDMVVFATLSRMVLDDVWVSELYADRAKPLQDAHRALEKRAWDLLTGVLTQSQADQLHEVIALWREQNPTVRSVGIIHFADFAKSVGVVKSGEDQKLGSIFSLLGLDPFSDLDPAVREITQTRQLAERSIFYLQRAPALLNMQVERFADQLAIMPETKSMLASVERASLVGSAADHLATSLPDTLAKEREALVSQLMFEIGNQRGHIGALSADMRATLQAGTETATALRSTLEMLDRISARYPGNAPGNGQGSQSPQNARPFDIREYTDTIRELAVTTRELNSLAQHLDGVVPVIHSATQDATDRAEYILGRTFRLLLMLVAATILGILIAALIYRAIANRMSVERSASLAR